MKQMLCIPKRSSIHLTSSNLHKHGIQIFLRTAHSSNPPPGTLGYKAAGRIPTKPIAKVPKSFGVLPTPPKTADDAPRLNPPRTTRPPPLSLPMCGNEPFYKYAYRTGKAYLLFYKAGMKGILANYKAACAIPDFYSHPLFSSRSTIYAAASKGHLSRAEYQLLLRTRADAKVLPLFALLFAICGEFTPLLVPFLTPIVPPTLRIPSQEHKRFDTAARRRKEERARGPQEWKHVKNIWELRPQGSSHADLQALFRRLAIELAVYPAWWENIGPQSLWMIPVKARLRRRLTELKYDDVLMIREGRVQRLEPAELFRALERRGIDIAGRTMESEWRNSLQSWLVDGNGDGAKKLGEWLQGGDVEWDGSRGQKNRARKERK